MENKQEHWEYTSRGFEGWCLRGRPELSTLSKAYTEYILCDPLPRSQKST